MSAAQTSRAQTSKGHGDEQVGRTLSWLPLLRGKVNSREAKSTQEGKVNSKAVTRGPKSTGFAFLGGSPARATEAFQPCQPCTSAAHPCRCRLCRRAPSRTHALSHAALPSRKHPVSCWPRLTSHTPPLRHLAISPSPPSTSSLAERSATHC
eukprot:scaffold50203_cov64-Phaeocystis_antarctica.AAC.1